MLMDVPAFFLALFLLNKIGRKTMLAACMLIGGSSCSITMLTTVFGGKGRGDRGKMIHFFKIVFFPAFMTG